MLPMVTSQFVEFGGPTNAILNIAHITAIHKVTTTITEHNQRHYRDYPVVDGKAYTIQVYVTGRGGVEIIYESEEIRDEKYESLRRVLAPVCITPDLPPGAPSAPRKTTPRKPKEPGQ